MTASTSSTPRPTTSGTLVAGFPRGRFSASPGTRVLSFSRASSTTLPADALRRPGPLGAREGARDIAAGRIERSARPLPVAGAGLDQAAQRLVCGAAPRAVLDGHLIARQADRAVDVADRTRPASSRTPYPTAEQAGPQVLRAPVAAALSSPPPDPLPGLAAALRGLTHEAARFPQFHSASSSMIRYQTDDEGVVSQPEYTLTKPSNGPNDRDHLNLLDEERKTQTDRFPQDPRTGHPELLHGQVQLLELTHREAQLHGPIEPLRVRFPNNRQRASDSSPLSPTRAENSLLRRLRRIRNRLHLRLAEHLSQDLHKDVLQIIGRHADHLGVQTKTLPHPVPGDLRLGSTHGTAVLQQHRNRPVRVQDITRTATTRTLPRPANTPQPGGASAGDLHQTKLPKSFQAAL